MVGHVTTSNEASVMFTFSFFHSVCKVRALLLFTFVPIWLVMYPYKRGQKCDFCLIIELNFECGFCQKFSKCFLNCKQLEYEHFSDEYFSNCLHCLYF